MIDKRLEARAAIAATLPPSGIVFPSQQFKLIACDPPWPYKLRDKDRTHRNRISYPPMKTEQIMALPVAGLCDPKGCTLYLWTTNNHMREAYRCLDAWGFEAKTICTWEKMTNDGTKPRIGVGHYLRNCTEHFIVATKGKPGSASHRGTLGNHSTILHAPRREHSRKPDEFFNLVDELHPGDSKIELFARESRPDWTAWGLESALFDNQQEVRA